MKPTLDATERRILGVLIEKLLATPRNYPLTLNALTNGCNQKSAREPRMSLSEETVERTLRELMTRGLVSSHYPESGRVKRWRSRLQNDLELSEREMAVLAELLLRGPQTAGQLERRASRMRHEMSRDEIHAILDEWSEGPDALVVRLPKESGQRHHRWAHTLYPDEEQPTAAPTSPAPPPERSPKTPAVPATPNLEARIEALEKRIEAIEERLEEG